MIDELYSFTYIWMVNNMHCILYKFIIRTAYHSQSYKRYK